MKRVDLIKELHAMGCELIRHGGKHDWYWNPATRMSQPVPRHREIKDRLARKIIDSLRGPRPSPPPAGGDA